MLGPYKDFDTCVIDQKAKGLDTEKASEFCRAIQARFHDKEVDASTFTVVEKNVKDELFKALEETYEENVVEEAFILGNDTLVTKSEMREIWVEQVKTATAGSQIDKEPRGVTQKAYEGSQQNQDEINQGSLALGFGQELEEVNPPYDPVILRQFLELDATHYRAVKAKVADSVGRSLKFEAKLQVVADDEKELPSTDYITQSEFNEEVKEVKSFIAGCNDIVGFETTIEKAAMDYEAIGYCAIEVIRSIDGVARKINHVPAERIKVLKGWNGFIEEIDSNGKKVFYQNIGDGIASATRKDPISGLPAKYDPDQDGPIGEGTVRLLIDRETGEPTEDVTRAANEIIYKFNPHPKSIYYGIPDHVPAAGHMLANAEIRDYLLQFFEHNTVPRYAVIIKGAKVDSNVKETIQQFFSKEVKGHAHKTLLIPIASVRGEVEVIFEKLDSDEKEASFQEAKKNNDQVIMVAHGTPPAILGIAEAANLGSGKGMSQAEIYKDRIITPRQNGWAKCLDKLFRMGLGVRHVRPKYDPLDVRDREAEMTILTGYQAAGNISTNEVREKAELGDPIKGGDRPYITVSSGLYFVDTLDQAVGGEFERSGRGDGESSQEMQDSEENSQES